MGFLQGWVCQMQCRTQASLPSPLDVASHNIPIKHVVEDDGINTFSISGQYLASISVEPS